MIGEVVLFLVGLVSLLVGAEALVRGASRLAIAFGISPLVVGLTVVAFGTSAPEMAVAAKAVLGGANDIAVGNVIGSNIFNILVILGLSALVAPLVVHTQVIRQEVPVMIAVSLLLLGLSLDGAVGRVESLALFGLLFAYNGFLVIQARRRRDPDEDALPATGWDRHWAVQLSLVVGGLGLLVLGSHWLVDAASTFARAIGASEVVIGLTIVAAGTSLPEVATSVMAAVRGQRDIAVGNVVGSNVFNILGCIGLAGSLTSEGLVVAPSILRFDLWFMVAVAVATVPIFLSGHRVERWEGVLFLGVYAAYTVWLILDATGHDAVPAYSGIMLWFVAPLLLVTLGVVMWRGLRGRATAGA